MATNPRLEYESLSDAAERTGISIRTLRRRITSGQRTAYRLGRVIRVQPDDADQLLMRIPIGGR